MVIKAHMTHPQIARQRPFEHAVALLVTLTALLSLLTGGSALGEAGTVIGYLWSALALLGGASALAGMHLHRHSPPVARRVEQAGWEVTAFLLIGGPLAIVWATGDLSLLGQFVGEFLLAAAAVTRGRVLASDTKAEGERLNAMAEEG